MSRFDKVVDRKNTNSIKWDMITIPNATVKPGVEVIPMWVADMDFETAPSLIAGIQKRLEHPVFGYAGRNQPYFDAIKNWHKTRYNVADIVDDYIAYENGVLGAVSTALRTYTVEGDPVLINSTTYIGFTGVLNGLKREIVHSALVEDANGIMRMDYEDMEKKIVEKKIKAYIFCSPHNPSGRVWDKDELEKMIDICHKHKVVVISDEIWADFTYGGKKHIPTYSVNDKAAECVYSIYAIGKTFNMASMIAATSVCKSPAIREAIRKCAADTHLNGASEISLAAVTGAYQPEGAAWVDELIEYLKKNIDYAVDFVNNQLPGVTTKTPEGTYLLFLDAAEYLKDKNVDLDTVLQRFVAEGVIPNDGRPFGGATHIRLNMACRHDSVVEAMKRLKEAVFI